MNWNLNSGYGAHLANAIMCSRLSGKIFIVGASGVAYRDQIQQLFQGDVDGKVRFTATIAAAVALCTASGNDQIMVLPGHTESVSAAAGIALSTAGISLIGLGTGTQRPTITFDTATTATMTVTAANVTIDNFVFTQAFDAIVSPIVVSAAGFTMKNCYVMTANASYQCTQFILTTAAANNMTIVNNRFNGTVDAGTTAVITIVGGDNAYIADNDFIGAYTSAVGAIQSITTLNTNCVIRRNTIVNKTAGATKGITLLTGSTGVIAENKFGIGSGAAPITGDAVHWVGNWSAAAVATNGTLV